ncbi:MAG: DUF3307 domain-containing protein [Hyphomicrobiaceae bacterium]|nr:DUF3307 domain-containing protein [Hyphomicrobiaceae bacterium]
MNTMPQSAETVLALLTYLLVKHVLFDFVFQSSWQVENKGRYGHPAGFVHAGLHGLGTFAALLLAHMPLEISAMLGLGEGVFHYHADWAKDQITRRFAWTPKDQAFWTALGIDQTVHHASYLAVAAIAVMIA